LEIRFKAEYHRSLSYIYSSIVEFAKGCFSLP
jgi:hypothetical protein